MATEPFFSAETCLTRSPGREEQLEKVLDLSENYLQRFVALFIDLEVRVMRVYIAKLLDSDEEDSEVTITVNINDCADVDDSVVPRDHHNRTHCIKKVPEKVEQIKRVMNYTEHFVINMRDDFEDLDVKSVQLDIEAFLANDTDKVDTVIQIILNDCAHYKNETNKHRKHGERLSVTGPSQRRMGKVNKVNRAEDSKEINDSGDVTLTKARDKKETQSDTEHFRMGKASHRKSKKHEGKQSARGLFSSNLIDYLESHGDYAEVRIEGSKHHKHQKDTNNNINNIESENKEFSHVNADGESYKIYDNRNKTTRFLKVNSHLSEVLSNIKEMSTTKKAILPEIYMSSKSVKQQKKEIEKEIKMLKQGYPDKSQKKQEKGPKDKYGKDKPTLKHITDFKNKVKKMIDMSKPIENNNPNDLRTSGKSVLQIDFGTRFNKFLEGDNKDTFFAETMSERKSNLPQVKLVYMDDKGKDLLRTAKGKTLNPILVFVHKDKDREQVLLLNDVKKQTNGWD